MSKKFSIVVVLALWATIGVSAPASANPQTEGIYDACFDVSSGLLDRSQSRNSGTDGSDNQSWYQTNTLVRKSGQVFRGTYSGYQDSYQNTYEWARTQVEYEFNSQQKTVYSQNSSQQYFSSVLYERFFGWLVSESGDRLQWTSWTSRTRNTNLSSSELSRSTQTIARDCTVIPLAADVVKFELKAGEARTLQTPTYSADGYQMVQIDIAASTFTETAVLLVWNDPNATENRNGLGSLGFRLANPEGRAVAINQPITLTFEKTKGSALAHSLDAANWTWLRGAQALVAEGVSVSKASNESFLASSLSPSKWVFVGQKQDQSTPIAYANRFSGGIGAKIKLTTTSGSGKGPVNFRSLTPEVCKITSARIIQGISAGDCKVLAIKSGFDGFMDAKTQTLSLKIGS